MKEGRWIQINNVLEYLEAFPELEKMTFKKRYTYLKKQGLEEIEALRLAARTSLLLNGGMTLQDVWKIPPDNAMFARFALFLANRTPPKKKCPR